MSSPVKLIFGTHTISTFPVEVQKEFFSILKEYGIKDLDTAYIYAGSEQALGDIGAAKTYAIHTKAPGFIPGFQKKDSIIATANESLKRLGVDQVDTYFLHSPDPETHIEDTLEGVQEVYKSGKFKHFGLSNFPAADVEKIHAYMSSHAYVLPTVYQGNYNPVARHADSDLFPLLRKLGMRFYAYSPLAGGFLTKSAATIAAGNSGRFNRGDRGGQLYQRMYNRPSLLTALEEWDAIACDAGISRAALAYRFVAFHSSLDGSKGDGVVVGASRPEQLRGTLEELRKGGLEPSTVERVERVWESVKGEAPVDNFADGRYSAAQSA